MGNTPKRYTTISKTKHPDSAMMLGVVASNGAKMDPIWFGRKERVNAAKYVAVLKEKIKPWLEANFPDGNYVWQQDGAPCHTVNVTQKWCQDNINFWNKHFWPPSSPDLNPLTMPCGRTSRGRLAASATPAGTS